MQLLDDFSTMEANPVNRPKDFITVRLDEKLKRELEMAADLEKRSLSNLCRLLLEYAYSQYHEAGSLHELLMSAMEQTKPKQRSLKYTIWKSRSPRKS